MSNFIVIEKDSLSKSTVNSANITLTEASIVHTKMHRDDVAEFIRDGNNLVLKLKNGEVVVIENFFVQYDEVASDLVFEEDNCALYWFDGVSGFKGIPGLEALLPAVEGSKLIGLLPWIVGGGLVAGGIIAATDDDDKDNIPNGTNTIEVTTDGEITGKTENISEGTDVKITIKGQDKDGNPLEKEVTVKVDKDGNYTVEVPPEFADGDLTVESEVKDKNGNTVTAEDSLDKVDHDNDPTTPDQGGLDLDPGSIDLTIGKDGSLTGVAEDVAPGTEVIITVQGVDKDGKLVKEEVKTTVKPDGSYEAKLPADTTIVDGSPLVGEAVSTDRNGNEVSGPDELAGAPGITVPPGLEVTLPPENGGGLDLDPGSIDLTIGKDGSLTGVAEDVAPGTEVIITVQGVDKDGKLVKEEVKTTVKPDGSYEAKLPADTTIVDGSPLVGEAVSTDRNGNEVSGPDELAGAPGITVPPGLEVTLPPENGGGLDLDPGSITVDIDDSDSTNITGTTQDVAPNSKVTLEITSIDENGETLTFTKEVITDENGHYSYTLTPGQGNATNVVAKVNDRNGNERQDNDELDAVVKADPSTDVNNGDNDVVGTSGNDVLAGDTGGLKTNFETGKNYNVSLVLDLSGSMKYALGSDKNPTNGESSRLDIAKAGLKAFIQQMVEHDGVINLQLASFSSDGYKGNNYNKSWVVSKDNLQDIFNYIDGLQADGGTNPNVGWDKASKWFDGVETGLEQGSVKADSSYENQTYFLTDGKPNTYNGTGRNPTDEDMANYDADFTKLANKGKVFAVGVSKSSGVQDAVSRYDNTDEDGNIIPNWSKDNHGDAKAIADADKLIAYLIGGSENFLPADVGNDTVKGGAGDDILFGDAMNTDWITGLDQLQYPQYSGYSKLIAHLKAEVTSGAEPTQQEIYDFVKANFQKFVDADAIDSETKGGDDTIYGGSGNDMIIAGAGNDQIYGGSGDDIISTGSGSDMIIYDVLNAADATGGNGTDTWVDYDANDVIGFGADFFEGLFADKSNISEYIKVEDVDGKAVLKIDRDGAANGTSGTTHDWADLLIIEGKTAAELQNLIDDQIYIG